MPLAELSKQKLLSFIGYGPNSPRFIFVGSEEARTGDAMTNILARVSSFEFPRHDSFTALKQLAAAHAAATYKGAAKHARAYAAEAAPGNIPVDAHQDPRIPGLPGGRVALGQELAGAAVHG